VQNKYLIIGCGDIGRRVAKLHQNDSLYAVVQSEASVLACQKLGIIAQQADFDRQVSVPKEAIQSLYYFMPPPSTGRDDTRIKAFLKKLESSNQAKKRIVLISTTGVYGDSKGAWIDETTPTNPKADRAYRRLSAEKYLIDWSEKTGGEYMILRVPGIYAKDRLPLVRLKKGLPVVNASEAGWTNRIHADDLAQACKAAMQCACSNEIINICDGNPSTMTDYFNQVADYARLPRPPQISMKEAEAILSKGMVSYLKESRRIRNKKMLKILDFKLQYTDLSSCLK